MDGSPSSLILCGMGNGTFNGSPSLLVTRGLGIGEALSIVTGPYRVTAQDYHRAGQAASSQHSAGPAATDSL